MDDKANMTLGEASAIGTLLEIDHPSGGLRYMVHVFDLGDGGIAWVDSGWTDPLASGHVCHFIPGTVTPSQSGWCLHSDNDGKIELRVSSRESSPEGDRAQARKDLQQEFHLSGLSC